MYRVLLQNASGEWVIVAQEILLSIDAIRIAEQLVAENQHYRTEEYGPGIPESPGPKRYALVLDPLKMKTTFS
jgi:hypothetical protein